MKHLLYLLLGLVLASSRDLPALEKHPFITRLCAQIESQVQTFDKVVKKLQRTIVDKRLETENPEAVLKYLEQAQDSIDTVLNSPQRLTGKKMFLLPTYLETAVDHTIDRWCAKQVVVPSSAEFQIIPLYAESLVKVLVYLRTASRKSLEESVLDTKSTYLTLFSQCVQNSIILSLYTLKTKKLLDRILQRLHLLNALLEEYNKQVALMITDPVAKKSILAYSAWTQHVIQHIVSSKISANNPQNEKIWRPKVPPIMSRVASSIGKKTIPDRLLETVVNRVSRLTLTKPCFDYINSLIRCIRETAREVPLT